MPFFDYLPNRRSRDEESVRSREIAPFGRLFDAIMHDFPLASRSRVFSPSVSVEEQENEFVVSAEVPGIREEDIDISLIEGGLTISGEKKEEHEEKSGQRYVMERSFGRFERFVPIEAAVKNDEVSADYERGVLTIRLPKDPNARGRRRKIQIKPSAQQQTGPSNEEASASAEKDAAATIAAGQEQAGRSEEDRTQREPQE